MTRNFFKYLKQNKNNYKPSAQQLTNLSIKQNIYFVSNLKCQTSQNIFKIIKY